MSIAHIILGLLQQRERTGYDLKTDCFDNCIAHIWQADQAQIYRTLDKLEAQGWVNCTIEIQHDRPNRKVYRITDAGKAELQQWLQSHQTPPILREPLLMQLYLSAELSNEAIVALLEQEQTVRHQRLAAFEAVQRNFPFEPEMSPAPDYAVSRQQLIHQLVLDLLRRKEQTYLDWLQEAIQQIRASTSFVLLLFCAAGQF